MRYSTLLLIIVGYMFSIYACKQSKNNPYPNSFADTTAFDTYFGVEVADPYRWLEQLDSDSTKQWIKAQNKTTKKYFRQIPYLGAVSKRLSQLWNYTRYSSPFNEGQSIYYYKNTGLQNHAILYQEDKNGMGKIFIDPNTFSKDGSVSLSSIAFSEDGTKVALSISEGGSDWRKIVVIDVDSKKRIEDTIKNIKFSAISWKGEQGFYYSSYDDITSNPLAQKTSQHKLYYHQLGTSQSEDKIIFGGSKNPYRYIGGYITEDQQYLVVSAANTTYGNDLYIQRLNVTNETLKPIIKGVNNEFNIVYSKGNTLWVLTDHNAPNSKLISFTYGQFIPSQWKTIIPETNHPLRVSTVGDFFFAHYLKDATTEVKQFDIKGKLVRIVDLPGIGSAKGFSGKQTDKELYYSFTNYITATSIYKMDIQSGESSTYFTPDIDYVPENYISERIFYSSKDGTKIPMIISYKKGITKEGGNPLLLYGYGGFNISITPQFSVSNLIWMERGGILAVPNIRGGGEYGHKWHREGTQMNKQNVFDDFIFAAEYLIKKQYTSREFLAISGRSNGGLLVGACMTQRPDLFQVALPGVGVLDMLKYHQFTAGAGWAYDYGTSEDSKEMFTYLKNYSPVHNVRKKCYPATLVTTADHDDRVVPTHSYKFIAELQRHQSCQYQPTIIAIQTKAGHGAGKAITTRIEEASQKWAFVWWNMGFISLPHK